MDPFADMLAEPPAEAPSAAPVGSAEDLQVLFYQGDAVFDRPMTGPRDLAVDAALEQMMELSDRARVSNLFPTAFGATEPVVLDDPLFVPEDDGQLIDAFARYDNPAPISGGVFTPPPPGGIPAGPSTFGPLEQQLFPEAAQMNGAADSSGTMRDALRRLVRSV